MDSTSALLEDGSINPDYRPPSRVRPDFDRSHPGVAKAFAHYAADEARKRKSKKK